MFFASALMALLPSVAHDIGGSPIGYGVLLGCFGTGAVLGALALQYTRERWPTGVIVSAGIAIFGFTSIATAMLHVLWQLGALMLIGGAAWVSFISLFNVLLLNQTPDWVRARVLAISLLISQGAVAAGSALWGSLAARSGVSTALLWAGGGALAAAAVGLLFHMPEASLDLTPWNHWKMPPTFGGDPDASGPVLVTVEYRVDPEREHDFLQAMHQYGRIRRRDGASHWGICRDLETVDRYVETFVVGSWAEHLRQHERLTRADHELEQRLGGFIRETPTVRHLLYL
jgi:MFS family permease